MKRKFICFTTLITIILSVTFTANATPIDVAYDDVKIAVNFREVQTDVEPFIFNGRTFLPIRPVAEAMGAYVEWDNETKTVNILNYRIGELKSLSNGLDMTNDCVSTSTSIAGIIDQLTDYRNALVAECWGNLDEVLNGKIAFLDSTSEYLEWQISEYLPVLTIYPNTKAVNTDDLKNAFYYCQMAIHNVKLGYDELKKYNSNSDNRLILEKYAVFNNKASTYMSDAADIFRKCRNDFRDIIYSY